MSSISAIEDIDHSRTKTKSPQTNGICERFHKTVLNEFPDYAQLAGCENSPRLHRGLLAAGVALE